MAQGNMPDQGSQYQEQMEQQRRADEAKRIAAEQAAQKAAIQNLERSRKEREKEQDNKGAERGDVSAGQSGNRRNDLENRAAKLKELEGRVDKLTAEQEQLRKALKARSEFEEKQLLTETKQQSDIGDHYRPGISLEQPQSKVGGEAGEKVFNKTPVERARTPEEEKKEREKIYHPEDGVGFKFGSSKLEPKAIEHLEQCFQQNQEFLLDPKNTVELEGQASRPGSDDVNSDISHDRASAVKQWMKERGVLADIFAHGTGEDNAAFEGESDGVDYAEDRVVKIKIEGQTLKSDVPEKYKDADWRYVHLRIEGQILKSDVPEKYQGDYKPGYDRNYAKGKLEEYKLDQFLKIAKVVSDVIIMGAKAGTGALAWEAVVEIPQQLAAVGDYKRWTKEVPWNTPADEKLWQVTPPAGFSKSMKGSVHFRGLIEGILHQGGYKPEKMYREYLIHWIRKGAT